MADPENPPGMMEDPENPGKQIPDPEKPGGTVHVDNRMCCATSWNNEERKNVIICSGLATTRPELHIVVYLINCMTVLVDMTL